MTSLILNTASRFLKPLLIGFSLLVLLRGHNDPGGGFVGGLLAAAGFVLQAISAGVDQARRALRYSPHTILAGGLLLAGGSGSLALVRGQPFLTGQRVGLLNPGGGAWEVSTILLFDIGVYLVVLGTVLLIIFTLAEES